MTVPTYVPFCALYKEHIIYKMKEQINAYVITIICYMRLEYGLSGIFREE